VTRFSIDNHVLTVVSTDFVAIEPYQTETVFVNIGQRYDVIVKADQNSAKDYWLRAVPLSSCSSNSNQDGIKGIVHYGTSTTEPTTTAYTYVDECVDEPAASLVPVLAKKVEAADFEASEAVSVAKNANNFFEWTLNGTTFNNAWDNPPLLNVYNNDTTAIKEHKNLIELPTRGEWFYLLITEVGLPVSHPIHLHGHDFYVLGQGSGIYTGQEPVNTVNPPRRDVATLPAAGWLLLAWKADNPGTWLMHCHIGWHTLQGLALQFLELEDEILSTGGVVDADQLTGTCNNWNSYVAQYGAVQGVDGVVDSGL
jgi:FtsP/CotA-like multicopper oxidase with cupredoxin domain